MLNIISIGYISSLPANIQNEKTNLLIGEKAAKLPVGPTNYNPGPILLIVVITDVTVVTISKPSKATINIAIKEIII